MLRKIVRIDKTKCNGCALCVSACHEGAIEIQKGIAVLIRDDYCDGLGNCLPVCPVGAIIIEEREAVPFDAVAAAPAEHADGYKLANWPVQLKLAPAESLKLKNAPLLVAADCTAFAAPNLYANEAQTKRVLIGCPKLDV